MSSLSDRLEIKPLTHPPRVSVCVPGSKSITNRALVLAALVSGGQGYSLYEPLRSEDTHMMIQGLQALGFDVQPDWDSAAIYINAEEKQDIIPSHEANVSVGNSGTTMRFLTALVSLGHGRYRLDGVPRMRERPIGDLLAALRQLGVVARSEKDNGCPPVIIETQGLRGGHVKLRGDVSSQFLSALLMVAPAADSEVVIEIDGPLVSEPYVAMTVAMMRQWGFEVSTDRLNQFHIPGRQRSRLTGHPIEYAIEPDASAASYFWAAAAITGGRIRVDGLTTDSLQGDVRFVDVLQQMGCLVTLEGDGIAVEGRPLHGIDVDMNDISDTVMTLAVVACFAEGPTTIRNVAHIRHKETDRLHALATELRKIGATVEERTDGLRIIPGPLHGAEIDTYQDHRMAMSLALVGLRIPGIVIKDPGCVAKTYPDFFADLEKLR